jgi:hypothetical protein
MFSYVIPLNSQLELEYTKESMPMDYKKNIDEITSKYNGYRNSDTDTENVCTRHSKYSGSNHKRLRNNKRIYYYKYLNGNIRRIAKYKNNKLHGHQKRFFSQW